FLEMPWTQKKKNVLILQLGYKDIFLSFFHRNGVQESIAELRSGDALSLKEHGCYTSNNVQVLAFSKSFKERLIGYQAKGYNLLEARISAIVYWKQEDKEDEVRIIFPVIKLGEG
ncbi:MAG: hypothetical protein IBX70_13765, partial [Clostridia bacterium]|nr:hypothetical protein [Clostridia bacterium]